MRVSFKEYKNNFEKGNISVLKYILTLAVLMASAINCLSHSNEAIVKIKVQNAKDYDLTYHRSYNGVWLSTFTPLTLDSDSVCVINIPTESVERMMVLAKDSQKNLPSVYKSFYVTPGHNEVTIDPLAKEKIGIMPPTGNSLDGDLADVAEKVYDIWFTLATGGKDSLGLYSDTVPSSVTTKLEAFVDSLLNPYKSSTPELLEAARRDANLSALMVYQLCYNKARRKNKHLLWDEDLQRLRNDIDLNNSANGRSPYFSDIMNNFFFQDVKPERTISPDSLLRMRSNYILNTLSGKAAEAAFGLLLYSDGDSNAFSPSAPELTVKFKSLFPNSGLIPFLDTKLEENLAFNNPNRSEEIVFLDNSELNSLEQLFKSYNGKTVLIDLWATWCGPCRKSFEHVKPIQEYASDNDIQLLYISVDEENDIEERWRNMVKYYNLKGHHLLINKDIKQEVYSTFGNENGILSIPCYAVIDRHGNLTVLGSDIAESSDISPLREYLDKIK